MLATESSIVLDLVKIIEASMKYLEDYYILMNINNKKAHRNIHIEMKKASMYSSDSRLIFRKIKELLNLRQEQKYRL